MKRKRKEKYVNGIGLNLTPRFSLRNRASLSQNRVIVVCSARSTGKKAEGTTSR